MKQMMITYWILAKSVLPRMEWGRKIGILRFHKVF